MILTYSGMLIFLRFNRYMVECESSTAMLSEFVDFCFNRYMVECEYFFTQLKIFNICVLIDTWWNVNLNMNIQYRHLLDVLIDTWWNVNCVYST